MTRTRLVLRSLTHYWRTHLAVLLGVVIGTAVISGALVVGDSVRESLRQMSLDRLGGVDHALHSSRFFREDLVRDIENQPGFKGRFKAAAPALIMEAALVREADDGSVSDRAGGITVYGIDERFLSMSDFDEATLPIDEGLVLSHRVAGQLNASVGDELTLWVEMPSTIPRESLLGGLEDQDTRSIPVTVSAILSETSGTGRFDLNPGQQLPLTAFVSLSTLQVEIGLDRVRRSKAFPEGRPARVNAAFVTAESSDDSEGATAAEAADLLTTLAHDSTTLEDLSLRIVVSKLGYLALESQQMILADPFAAAARQAAKELGSSVSRNLVYLVNELANAKAEDAYSAYSIIAGLDPKEVEEAPFGPLVIDGILESLADDEVVLNDWLAADLEVGIGDSVRIRYHQVGSHGELPEEELVLKVHSIVPLDESKTAGDRSLTPQVRGITDAKSFRDWKQPFQMDIDHVTDRDDDYWEEYRALPKAFVSLELAQSLWKSRYGNLTSVRVTPVGDQDIDSARLQFEREFLGQLDSQKTGIFFQPVKYTGVTAASGTTDFTGLFIGFSVFVIASAMILIGLLFRLGVERRTASIGLLEAVGFSEKQVRRLMLTEGLIVACVGGLAGSFLAVRYASLMVSALKDPDWWGGAIGTQFLFVHVQAMSLAIGFLISLLVALIALIFALRSLRDVSTRQLLAGETSSQLSDIDLQNFSARRVRHAKVGFGVSAVVLLAGLVGAIPASEAFSGLSWQMVAFFVTGILSLTSAMFFLSAWLAGDRGSTVRGSGFTVAGLLGFRNAARHRSRSVLSTGLIASATFVIVAVAAGQRDPSVEHPDVNSGNGGFALVAESAAPLIDSLSTSKGRAELGVDSGLSPEDSALLDQSQALAFRVRLGENASCLNLYQTTLPTILGVPDELIERGGFRFVDQRKADYWKLLIEPRDDGLIPVLGDMNTLMFSLHKAPGATIDLPESDEQLLVSGMFDGSVFQGVLLMSDSNFQKLFPDETGYRYFLIGANQDRVESSGHFSDDELNRLSSLLESQLTPYGFDAERVSDRIAAFLVVQNTYLSTFQSLGGLGLLLGTFGLATVMLRNVVERRSELALLRAVGFRRSSLSVMVLAENAMLLIWGLCAGTVSALLAMLPHLMTIGADTPWADGGLLLIVVFAAGMLAALLAVREASRTPIVSTLRGE